MRHGVDGRKLGRNEAHRKALFRNMANAVIQREQVITTLPKAKEVRRVVEKLITLGKDGNLHARRLAFSRTRSPLVVTRLFTTLAERYKARKGGYTRVYRLSALRRGDNAEMAVLELVDHPKLDRKRKKISAPEKDEKLEKAAPVDPLKGFKKMFAGRRGNKGVSGSQTSAAPAAVKKKSGRSKSGSE